MTDTQLILEEIKQLREAIEAWRELATKPTVRKKAKKKANPTLADCEQYAGEIGFPLELAREFYEFYTAGPHITSEADKWTDTQGKVVYSWQAKMRYWKKKRDEKASAPHFSQVSRVNHRPSHFPQGWQQEQ